MRKERGQQKQERYGQTVKAELLRRSPELASVIENLGNLFDEFIQAQPETGLKHTTELELLFLAKRFIERYREKVQKVTDRSMLENFDCVTQSIIGCMLADRAGFETSVGHPKELTRHFHAFIVQKNGAAFEMVGRREKKPIVVMRPQDAVNRLAFLHGAYRIAGIRARRRQKEKRLAGNNEN